MHGAQRGELFDHVCLTLGYHGLELLPYYLRFVKMGSNDRIGS